MANALASSNLTPASHAMGNLPTPNSAEIARLQGQFRMVWRSPDRAAKCPIRCNLRATPHLGVAREVMGGCTGGYGELCYRRLETGWPHRREGTKD